MVDVAKESPERLASLGASLYSAIADSQEQLDAINKELIKRHSGSGGAQFTTDNGERVEVIFPGKSIKPDGAAIIVAKRICGPLFSRLFQRVIVTKARKDFRSIAAAVLTPAKAEKVIAACEADSTAYVRYSV